MATDVELLEAWRAGDKEAGSQLFDRYFDALYAFFRNTASEGVDDLVQKTFLACTEGLRRIEGEFKHYMYGTAKKLLYREYARRRKDAAIDFGVTSAADLSPSPSSQLAAQEHRALVDAALRMIPIDFQVAVELRYRHGLTIPQIAGVLEIPLGTATSRIGRGLGRLRELVERLPASEAVASARAEVLAWSAAVEPEPVA